MPELPEVETVKRVLKENLISKSIIDIKSNYTQMVECEFSYFKSNLLNKTFKDVKRKGKYLIFCLDDIFILSHLRMEGKFFYVKTDTLSNEHIHMEFILSNGYSLLYQDVRKFGRMTIKKEDELFTTLPLSKLAKDANDTSFLPSELYNSLHKRKKTIKESLLDQSVISGLGNIYVDEVLFKSRINPTTPSNEVTILDCENILLNSCSILNASIKNKGTTIRSYTSSLNVYGNYQNFLNVHTKSICNVCNSKIIKIKVGGRGTYYCPLCQKKHKVIGITGSIACGKTFVSNYLKKLGYEVIDTDLISHQITQDNSKYLSKLEQHFPTCVINNKLDRKKLSNIIFNDKIKREELNNILHPLILNEVKLMINSSYSDIIFVDVPLMFEAHFDTICDKIICVYTDFDIQIERLIKRDNITKSEAINKINSQMPLKEKMDLSDYLIYSINDYDKVHENILYVLNKIKEDLCLNN